MISKIENKKVDFKPLIKEKNKKNKMKKNILPLVNLIILVIVCTYLFFNQLNKKEKLAYVETSILFNGYDGMKQANRAFEAQKTIWQANVDTLSSELQRSIQEHERTYSKMTDKEKELSTQLLDRKRQEYYQYKQAMEQKAQQEDQRMSSKVVEEINTFIKEYGIKNKYKIILGATGSGNLMYAEEELNITKEVLDQLNERYAK